MGQADSATKMFLRDNEVFADAFNYLIYDGKPVITLVICFGFEPCDGSVTASG